MRSAEARTHVVEEDAFYVMNPCSWVPRIIQMTVTWRMRAAEGLQSNSGCATLIPTATSQSMSPHCCTLHLQAGDLKQLRKNLKPGTARAALYCIDSNTGAASGAAAVSLQSSAVRSLSLSLSTTSSPRPWPKHVNRVLHVEH